jgi:hypothetical protein
MKQGFGFDHYARMCKLRADAGQEPVLDELVGPSDLEPEISEMYRNGFRRGFSTGWRSMDPHFTVRKGEFTVITGYPGSGKSSLLDGLMVNLTRSHHWKWPSSLPRITPYPGMSPAWLRSIAGNLSVKGSMTG